MKKKTKGGKDKGKGKGAGKNVKTKGRESDNVSVINMGIARRCGFTLAGKTPDNKLFVTSSTTVLTVTTAAACCTPAALKGATITARWCATRAGLRREIAPPIPLLLRQGPPLAQEIPK